MSKKIKLSVIIFFFALFGTWFYFTPYLAVNAFKAAAKEKDVVKLSSYINFPAVKESVKASLNAKLASEAMKEQSNNPYALIGSAVVAFLADRLIDGIVTPEGMAMMMKDGMLFHPGNTPTISYNSPIPAQPDDVPQPVDNSLQQVEHSPQTKASEKEAEPSMSYESFDRFVVSIKRKNSNDKTGMVFNREGWFFWKLSAVRLPS
ncbi:MAG: DUF2939 domain-containing protein [Chlorobiaceae bacterium]